LDIASLLHSLAEEARKALSKPKDKELGEAKA